MANFLNRITTYVTIGMVLFVLILIGLIVLYVMQRKKKSAFKEIAYDSFDKRDSLEYLKFNDIVSSEEGDILKGSGMIVVDKNTFVAGINVVGYNFYAASYDEQVHTINSMISLMDSLEYPVTFRQTTKAIDIGYNIGVFNQIKEKLESEVLELNTQRDLAITMAEDNIDQEEYRALYMKEVEELSQKITIKLRQLEEATEMVFYMESISSLSGDTQKVPHIMFSYEYDASQFTNQLTKEEIYINAMQELSRRASSIISALVRCGCSGRMMTAHELIDLTRRHMHPATSDEVTLDELFNSSINSLFITSDSMLQAMITKLTEEEYKRRLAQYEAEVEERRRRMEMTAEKAEQERLAITKDIAAKQVNL